MPFSLAELRHRATAFVRDHAHYHDEKSQDQDFWRDFLDVFTPQARRRARFQHRTKKLDGSQGYVDVFWPGTLLVEQKSKGKNLDAAHEQALSYLPNLPAHELPPVVVVSDFERFRLYELDSGQRHDFALAESGTLRNASGNCTARRNGGGDYTVSVSGCGGASLSATGALVVTPRGANAGRSALRGRQQLRRADLPNQRHQQQRAAARQRRQLSARPAPGGRRLSVRLP